MIVEQRLDVEYIRDRRQRAFFVFQGVDQRHLVDDRAARRIHEIGARLHLCEVARLQQTACAIAEQEVDGK